MLKICEIGEQGDLSALVYVECKYLLGAKAYRRFQCGGKLQIRLFSRTSGVTNASFIESGAFGTVSKGTPSGFLLQVRSSLYSSYLVDPASSHMLVSKIKPCMSKYKQLCTVKLRMAH